MTDRPARRRPWLRRSGWALLGTVSAGGALLFLTTGCLSAFGTRADAGRLAGRAKASTYRDGTFRNVEPPRQKGPSSGTMWEFFFGGQDRTPPGPLPTVDPRKTWSTPANGHLRVTWLGHSTLLVEADGVTVLTDPVWGERASPSTLVGPKRFHPPVVPLEDLPRLDAVILSHDHYDHLDMPTIEALAKTDVPFFVPLGLRDHLEGWGVPKERITELDWWEEAQVPGKELTLVSTPARHFSGRGLFDRNATLWTSWVIRTANKRVFFSGDTGLTEQFREIARRQGPFDLVMLEVGAFHPSWGDIHLGPDNALRAHQMLGGGPLLPIHWGTFNLALHPWDEPAERLAALAKAKGVPLLAPRLGAPVEVTGPAQARVDAWWREVKAPPEEAWAVGPASLD